MVWVGPRVAGGRGLACAAFFRAGACVGRGACLRGLSAKPGMIRMARGGACTTAVRSRSLRMPALNEDGVLVGLLPAAGRDPTYTPARTRFSATADDSDAWS